MLVTRIPSVVCGGGEHDGRRGDGDVGRAVLAEPKTPRPLVGGLGELDELVQTHSGRWADR